MQRVSLIFLLALLPTVFGYFKGDPVRMFKKMQFGESRTMWSDVLIGQAPLFGVNRQVSLRGFPTDQLKTKDELKVQFSFDNDKFITPWFTIISQQETGVKRLHTITFRFVISGATIKDVTSSVAYFHGESGAEYYEPHMSKQHHPKHEDEILVHYLWRHELNTDIRGGLNFLFVSGCLLTILSIGAVAIEASPILSTRPLLVPQFARGTGKLESFTLYTSEESVPYNGANNSAAVDPNHLEGGGGGGKLAASADSKQA